MHACDDQLIFMSSPPGERRGGGWANGKKRGMKREGQSSVCTTQRDATFVALGSFSYVS